jgi:hypothetical protein
MQRNAIFHNDWAVLSPDKDEAKRIQHELESRISAGAKVTMWLDEGLPRVDIKFDANRIMSPRAYVTVGETLRLALGKGLLYIAEMTPSSVRFYVNRTDLAPGPILQEQFERLGASFEDFRNCWEQYLS